MVPQVPNQLGDVSLKLFWLDLVLVHHRLANGLERGAFGDQIPSACTDRVEPEIGAALSVQDHNLFAYSTGEDVVGNHKDVIRAHLFRMFHCIGLDSMSQLFKVFKTTRVVKTVTGQRLEEPGNACEMCNEVGLIFDI